MIHRAARWLVDVVYPPTCAGCGRRGVWICERCLARHGPISGPVCDGCGMPTNLPCVCRALPLEIDSFRAAFLYGDWVEEAIHRFKYRDESARGRSLACAMLPALQSFGSLDALVPVSLHPKRRRERGYDQALILATELADLSGVPLVEGLERTRHTSPQVGQGHAGRRENVRGAFALRRDHALRPGCRVVLVDDVRTTGATLGECANALFPLRPGFIGALTAATAVQGISAAGGRP